jgi:hypothetical protein
VTRIGCSLVIGRVWPFPEPERSAEIGRWVVHGAQTSTESRFLAMLAMWRRWTRKDVTGLWPERNP